jgi:hypothetical protein
MPPYRGACNAIYARPGFLLGILKGVCVVARTARDAEKGNGRRRVTQSIVPASEFFCLVFAPIAAQYKHFWLFRKFSVTPHFH